MGLTFSCNAFSWSSASSCTDGGGCNGYTPQPGNASSGNMGAHNPGFVLGSGMGGGPSAADMEKKKAAEEAGIRAGCKAGQGSITFQYETCANKAINNYADSVGGCPPETDVTTEVNPVVGSVSASTSPNTTCVTKLKINYERDLSNCGMETGYTRCKSYGAF